MSISYYKTLFYSLCYQDFSLKKNSIYTLCEFAILYSSVFFYIFSQDKRGEAPLKACKEPLTLTVKVSFLLPFDTERCSVEEVGGK